MLKTLSMQFTLDLRFRGHVAVHFWAHWSSPKYIDKEKQVGKEWHLHPTTPVAFACFGDVYVIC